MSRNYESLPEYRGTEQAGHRHVFKFWEQLDDKGRQRLVSELRRVDFELVNRLYGEVSSGATPLPPAGELEPPPVFFVPNTGEEKAAYREAWKVGEEALRAGRVAVFLVAGGQGSRLGFDGPKGAFPVGPVTGRTLFQVFAEKIAVLRKRYSCALPWFIMTSETNNEATIDFFEQHDFFGLARDSIRFFTQEMLPAVDLRGRLLMADRDRLFWSPNGHGGSIKALADSGSLDYMSGHGVDILFYFQVDNPLVRICDPAYIGRHLIEGSEMSCKVVRKQDPLDRCGNPARHKGRTIMIEYSDLPDDLAQMCCPDGELLFATGSIAIHIFSVDFLKQLTAEGFQVPYHRALKAIPAVDDSGKVVKPVEKNGIKFESFVFDALPLAKKTLFMETPRGDEFSPVKNAEGNASPETSRRDLVRMYARWLAAAGIKVTVDENGDPPALIEISPLTSLFGEGLEKFRDMELDFTRSIVL